MFLKRGVSFLSSPSGCCRRFIIDGGRAPTTITRSLYYVGTNNKIHSYSLSSLYIENDSNSRRNSVVRTIQQKKRWMSSDDSGSTKPIIKADVEKEANEQDKAESSETEEEEVKEIDVDDLNDSIQHPIESLVGGISEYTEEVIIKMPDMGEGNENQIEKWYKQPGDIIKFNDVLCDISTPDFTFGMVIEDEEDAIMGEILVQEGDVADDNAPICITYHRQEVVDDDDDNKQEKRKEE